MPNQTTPAAEQRVAVASIVARSWAASISDAGHRHALAMVLAALAGQTDPAELGIDKESEVDAIRVATSASPILTAPAAVFDPHWAQPAQPATAPAEAAQEPPADPDPHPDTPPHASGILGRALRDRYGDLWPSSGDGWWREPGRPQADRRAGRVWTTLQVQREYGPVREVLLVDPAAWQQRERVIEMALARVAHIHESSRHPRGVQPEVWADEDELELIAAVDALTGGPDTNDDLRSLELPTPTGARRLAEQVREALATARRDTAAATLDEHARSLRTLAADPAYEARKLGLLRAASVAEQRAAEIRTGQRDVPGSPEASNG